MKEIINGKEYDTDTAEFLIRYCADCPDSDFNYYEERLYKKKKTGEYFIHGMGGALSPYRKIYDDGNTLGWGETIFLLTEEKAKEWVINHFKEIDYEHIFGQGLKVNKAGVGYVLEEMVIDDISDWKIQNVVKQIIWADDTKFNYENAYKAITSFMPEMKKYDYMMLEEEGE